MPGMGLGAMLTPALGSQDVLSDGGNPEPFTRGWLSDIMPEGQSMLAQPFVAGALQGTEAPPCTSYTEVELVGACWAPHEFKAPCPDDLYEYQGKCYLPTFSAKPPPQSLGQ